MKFDRGSPQVPTSDVFAGLPGRKRTNERQAHRHRLKHAAYQRSGRAEPCRAQSRPPSITPLMSRQIENDRTARVPAGSQSNSIADWRLDAIALTILVP